MPLEYLGAVGSESWNSQHRSGDVIVISTEMRVEVIGEDKIDKRENTDEQELRTEPQETSVREVEQQEAATSTEIEGDHCTAGGHGECQELGDARD